MPAKKKPAKKVKRAAKPKVGSVAVAQMRRAAFIEAYLANGGNATEAYKTAGYSHTGANANAARLIANDGVRAEIDRRRAEVVAVAEEQTGLTVAGVLTELRALVHSDLRRAFHPKSGELLPPHLWPDDLARAMCSIKVVEMDDGTKKHVPMYVKEVKLWDKGANMERAMKHLGMFKVDNAQRGDAAIRALMEAVSERSSGFEVRS